MAVFSGPAKVKNRLLTKLICNVNYYLQLPNFKGFVKSPEM